MGKFPNSVENKTQSRLMPFNQFSIEETCESTADKHLEKFRPIHRRHKKREEDKCIGNRDVQKARN